MVGSLNKAQRASDRWGTMSRLTDQPDVFKMHGPKALALAPGWPTTKGTRDALSRWNEVLTTPRAALPCGCHSTLLLEEEVPTVNTTTNRSATLPDNATTLQTTTSTGGVQGPSTVQVNPVDLDSNVVDKTSRPSDGQPLTSGLTNSQAGGGSSATAARISNLSSPTATGTEAVEPEEEEDYTGLGELPHMLPLEPGEKGAAVAVVQGYMVALGKTVGALNAEMNNDTVFAVKKLQEQFGLPVTGTVDPATWTRLHECTQQPLPPDNFKYISMFEPVPVGLGKIVQGWLKKAGKDCGTVDGKIGNTTAYAVKMFQKERGIPQTGVVDWGTFVELHKAAGHPAPDPKFTVFKRNSTGDEVLRAQFLLKKAGMSLGKDPDTMTFGNDTQYAVKLFQQRNGLEVTEELDYPTWVALHELTKTPMPDPKFETIEKKGSANTAENVKKIQTGLKAVGFLSGSIDGQYGPGTELAVKKFQESNGLPPTGTVDSITWNAVTTLRAPRFEDVNWSDMSCRVSKYFTVGDFLRHDPHRIPKTDSIKRAAYKALQELDLIREAWGGPLEITSGYRPPDVNKAVGGVKYSQHLNGHGMDIKPADGRGVLEFQTWLDKRWYGALGWGARKGFVHIDMRNGKGFMDGGPKGPRWPY